jgi:ABC-type cobalamin/Fe3+-siderophores transport system ATPase subunit
MVGKRNELHVWKDSRKDATTDFRKTTDVDVRDLIGRMQYIEALTRFQDQSLSGIPHLEICYERDLLPQKEHQNTANRIFEFLGLAPTPVQTQLRKLTSNDLSQIISNIEEVEEALKNTRFAGFLDAYAQPS